MLSHLCFPYLALGLELFYFCGSWLPATCNTKSTLKKIKQLPGCLLTVWRAEFVSSPSLAFFFFFNSRGISGDVPQTGRAELGPEQHHSKQPCEPVSCLLVSPGGDAEGGNSRRRYGVILPQLYPPCFRQSVVYGLPKAEAASRPVCFNSHPWTYPPQIFLIPFSSHL